MKRLNLTICVLGLMLSGAAFGAIYDDFEDGVIDTSLWVVGGGARGWHADQPIGTGPWEYSLQEIVASPDGYFQAHVWGPMSGNTYGAEAWIRTLDNFNDGKNYVINFTWEPGFLDYHNNGYFIQVTDGYIANPGHYYWMYNMWPYDTTDPDLAGTTDFLWTPGTPPFSGVYFDNMPSIGKVSWSFEINSLGTACLYDSPDASGSILHEATLDPSRPWYIRFMLHDGTSAGFPAGDACLKLYHFVARPSEEGQPPIADAGDDIIADANEKVTLDGSGSSDPDGQIIRYTWKRLPDGVVIYSGKELTCQTKALGRVEEVIELTVTDNYLATATDTLKIISRTTQDLKDQLAAMQSQIQQLQQQSQETRDLVDRICAWPPIRQWLRRAIRLGDLNQDGRVNMSDFALLTKDWLR